MTYEKDLARIVEDVAGPQAARIDREGAFPRAAIDDLAGSGILALTVPAGLGGGGLGLAAASDVVQSLATVCGSTAMVVTMHYAATAVLAATGREDVLREIARGAHLTTLAFSESGSRSQFWSPVSTAAADGAEVVLDARKSWVTSAHEADSYVWSSRPLAADGPMSLWLVRTGSAGLSAPAGFDGLGLRGNDSCPVTAEGVRVARTDLLGGDGSGLDIALTAALPWFLLLNASASAGLMRAVTDATTQYLTATRLEHLGQSLARQLPSRARLARMRIETDRTRAHVADAIAAVESGREDAQLLVLEVKAAADEAAAEVADAAMAACGGAAFRKELPVERRFRDSRAARVMAPTTDALLDFVGRALCGLPLLDA
ncbi:acyl-CoA dehydrogenase family protein [Amycolatopsis endophytica]|uniref:Alkylation response protein AidB-like acyl-CoA dehydrogenase n=1 Tax=Amycolatopsis endophytica TaxID=860233 RepID=A0A853BCQ5_9PSEU|nr:acyl-CoA dehydrogenase family protein [Amycolatopsis endophytica]NYI93188.1 alkylation response protein AidB-like acyl-CoA dehydrogenase [Amycolatopsis endophytica]